MLPKKFSLIFMGIFLDVYSLEFVKEDFQKPHLQVLTSSGIVQGTRFRSKYLKNGFYYAYLGIPYAEAPVGDLRFRPPKWVKNWSGVLDGSKQRSNCIEINIRVDIRASEISGNEDCLFLNVFTTTNSTNRGRLKPVMVFIHGGGYILGSSDITYYGPDLLISKDVLVVTFNYRLGPFGFLSTEDLASPGNYGLKDQNLALQWVRKNIKFFGGDPDNVTIFGQSAGSASVHFHMLSPKSRGLFNKALLESGSALCFWGSQRKPRSIAYLLGAANGITNPKDSYELVNKLRAVHINDLKQSLTGVIIAALLQFIFTGLPFAPTLEVDHDEAFLTKNYWYEMLREGDFNRVPTVMGINSNETIYYIQEVMAIKTFLSLIDLDNGIITSNSMNISDALTTTYVGRMILDRYFVKNSRVMDVDVLNIIWFESDDMFKRPLWKTAELMSQHIPLYFYNFRYESELGRFGLGKSRKYPGVKGVSHEEEVHFIFNKLDDKPTEKTDDVVRERLLTLWTNFAKLSNPTPIMSRGSDVLGNIIWPTFNSSQKTILDIDKILSLRETLDDHSNIIWWNDLFKKYGNPPFHTY